MFWGEIISNFKLIVSEKKSVQKQSFFWLLKQIHAFCFSYFNSYYNFCFYFYFILGFLVVFLFIIATKSGDNLYTASTEWFLNIILVAENNMSEELMKISCSHSRSFCFERNCITKETTYRSHKNLFLNFDLQRVENSRKFQQRF